MWENLNTSYFRPMLAAKGTEDEIKKLFDKHKTLICSTKLDGIRAILKDGKFFSRSGKLIPNLSLQRFAKNLGVSSDVIFDGELIIGSPTAHDVFNKTTSGVMSINKEITDWKYWIFDCLKEDILTEPFYSRSNDITPLITSFHDMHKHMKDLKQVCCDYEAFKRFLENNLFLGYEGVIIRRPQASYKHGRSTLRSADMIKVKPLASSEARILSFIPEYKNDNPAFTNELGYTKRSSKGAGMLAKQSLGAFKVKDVKTGVIFSLGSGFTKEERKLFWQNQEKILKLNPLVLYTYLPYGVKDKPRNPIFKGFRAEIDL